MIRIEPRITVAAISVFVALAGLGAALRGMIFDKSSLVRCGVAVIIASVALLVVMLNPPSSPHEW
jgi:phosphoribosylcarboxyaminoimidazole (NCAIR) mutase